MAFTAFIPVSDLVDGMLEAEPGIVVAVVASVAKVVEGRVDGESERTPEGCC